MWYEFVEKSEFLEKLYNNIPELNNVNILRMQLCENGSRVNVSIFIPVLVDNPPPKWKQLKYDSAIIDLDLFAVSNVLIKGKSKSYIGDICIKKEDEEAIVFKCKGNVVIEIYAEVGIIQGIRGCRIQDVMPVR